MRRRPRLARGLLDPLRELSQTEACRSEAERCPPSGMRGTVGLYSAAHQPSRCPPSDNLLTLLQLTSTCGRSCSAAPHKLDSLLRRKSSAYPPADASGGCQGSEA